jgi:hypothetical protein
MPDIEGSRQATNTQAALEAQGPLGDGLLGSVCRQSHVAALHS